MPGDDISKIPRITNDGNDCYVRAKLEFSGTDVDLEKELYGFLLVGKNTMTDITIIKIS